MADDKSHIYRSGSLQRAAGESRATMSFKQFCNLDETRRHRRGKADPVRQIMTHIDGLAKKVGKERNPKRRDRDLAQQNRALSYLAVYLSKAKRRP